MPKDNNFLGQYRRAQSGVASVAASSSAPPSGVVNAGVGGGLGVVACDTCGLTLPRSATHIDVVSHPCYRLFSISVNAAGQIVLS